MKNTTITKNSVRVFVGTTVLGMVFTPAVKHHKPSPDVVISYLAGHKYYNPMSNMKDWNRSEARKNELLSKIRTIREQIRTLAEQQRTNNPNAVDKLIETVASTMMANTRAREYQMKARRAAELRTLPRFINYETLKRKTGIVEIELV